MHLQKGAQEVHNQKVRASFINIIVEAMLNYQIAYCATTKVLSMLLCYKTNTTNTAIFLLNISKLKHNQIIIIQTQKHNFKINQIITIKAKKRKKKDRRQNSADPSGLGWGRRWATARRWKLLGMFLIEGEKENFLISERVLESSKKKTKERERERERERESRRKKERMELLECSEWRRMREKENKRSKVEIVVYTCVDEKKKKKKGMKRMVESEMKKGKII